MKILLTFSCIALLACSNSTSQQIELQKSMAQFDQAFLPMLLYTYEGNTVQAKKMVFYVEFQWQRLKNQHQNQIAEPDWKETFRSVSDWLSDAYYAIDADCPELALSHLEHAKYELIALREQYDIDYYLDDLYDFQTTIDVVYETANDEMLCLLQWEDLEQQVTDANFAWQVALAQPFDKQLFEFDENKEMQRRIAMQAVSDAMGHLNEMLECADREQVALACKKLVPVFMQVLQLFGNFEESATYFAQQQ